MQTPSRRSHRNSLSNRSRSANVRGCIERLEERQLLSISSADYELPSSAWFAAVSTAGAGAAAACGSASGGAPFIGPVQQSAASPTQWIVRLTQDALSNVDTPAETAAVLGGPGVSFRVIMGLGLPGQVLIDAPGASDASAEAALGGNSKLAYYERNATLQGQEQIIPSDPVFGEQWGLNNTATSPPNDHDIDAPEAWTISTGSSKVVVGVIDSGIDYTHIDLYSNVWINQGEIPAALRSQLTDVNGNGLIDFQDLNDSRNSSCVTNFNSDRNTYIDAYDLLHDPRWCNGVNDDDNVLGSKALADDIVGWNFVNDSNDPFDDLGHGTEVAGIIGATGNNEIGVSGVAWQTSLMPIKFLGANNTGTLSNAALSFNYATMMRGKGVNVRAVNASFVTPDPDPLHTLRNAVQAAGAMDTGILVVAAAGNTMTPNRPGANLDEQPLYPASYNLDNIIAVAASDPNDHLAEFSNYGYQSVDLAAPGVSIQTTKLGGGYDLHDGTSMAAPFVTGTAALVWSNLPYATAAEVRRAILETTDSNDKLQNWIARGGRLNAYGALLKDTVAPRATLLSAPDIMVENTADQSIAVQYTDNRNVIRSSLDGWDIVVRRQNGTGLDLPVHLISASVAVDAPAISAIYALSPPNGRWNAASSGIYEIYLLANQIRDESYNNTSPVKLGSFVVNVAEEGVYRVNSPADNLDAILGDGLAKDGSGKTTLRAAIQEANLSIGQTTILLDPGTYALSIPGVRDDDCLSGDLDIRGDVVISGSSTRQTIIDAQQLDRIFDIQQGGKLTLSNLTLTGGIVEELDAGGAIRNLGTLVMNNCTIEGNLAGRLGGALHNRGVATIDGCTFDGNIADSVSVPAVNFTDPEFCVNSVTAGVQNAPQVAMNAAGQSVVVWRTPRLGYQGASFQRYDAQGEKDGGEISVGYVNPDVNRPVSVAMDAAGNFAVAWVGYDVSGMGIRVQLYNADGTLKPIAPFWANLDYQLGDQVDPSIVMDSDGNFVVAWTDKYGYDGSGSGIFYQCFGASGYRVGATRLANSFATGEQSDAALAMDSQGNFIIAWKSVGQENTHDLGGIYFRLFDERGNVKSGEQDKHVNNSMAYNANDPNTTSQQSRPAVAFDPSGNFLVAWDGEVYDPDHYWKCYARRYDSLGSELGEPFSLNTAGSSQIDPVVGFDSNGNFFAAWSIWSEDGSAWGVFGRLFDNLGNARGETFRISTTSEQSQMAPVLAVNTSGNAMVVWEGNGHDVSIGIDDSLGIFGQRLTLFSKFSESEKHWAAVLGETQVNTATEDSQNAVQIATNAAGRSVIAWRTVYGSVSARIFDALGVPGGEINIGAADNDVARPVSVAMDAAGNFAVAWVAFDAYGKGIRVQLYGADGTPQPIAPFWANSDKQQGDQSDPSIAVDSAGNIVVAWTDNGADAGIYYRRFSPSGVPLRDTSKASTFEEGVQSEAVLAMDAQGNFVIAWKSVGQENSQDQGGIYYQLYDEFGNSKLGLTERQASVPKVYDPNDPNTTSPQGHPAVAFDPSGNFLVAWDSQIFSGPSEYYWNCFARRFDSQGDPLAGEFVLNTAANHSQTDPEVAYDSQGNFIATWQNLNKDSSGWGIYGQLFDSSGKAKRIEFRVNTTTVGTQEAPDLAVDANGNAVIVWDGGGSTDFAGIFMQRFLDDAPATGDGGAIANEGTLSIANSTLSGNLARLHGGGLFNAVGASVELDNCTIAFNDALDSGGGLWNASGGIAKPRNTLVAGNLADGSLPDVGGHFASRGYNLVGQQGTATGFDQTGDQFVADAAAFLGPLQDNGGDTDTHELLAGSSALDAGLNGVVAKDQRGIDRPQNYLDDESEIADIGAFERNRGEIRGRVFRDLDHDGVEDAGEPGLAGRSVYLDSNENGVPDPYEPLEITREDGSYVFSGLFTGGYSVRRVVPSGWTATYSAPGSEAVNLHTGESKTNVDFGDFGLPCEIAGTVFDDLNRDNYRQESESKLSGWTIYIDANDNGVLDTDEVSVQTDAVGRYRFAELPPLKNYILREVPQADWLQTLPRLVDEGKWVAYLQPGEAGENFDFGNYDARGQGVSNDGSISGILFDDLNGDGIEEENEKSFPLSGRTVYLDLKNNNVFEAYRQTITDASGAYSFTNLGPGTYSVRIASTADSTQTTPAKNEFITTSLSNTFIFRTGVQYTQWTPANIASADFYGHGNGDQDILATDMSNFKRAYLWKNNGGGAFGSPITISTFDFAPSGLAVGDFTHDGKIDFAVGARDTNNILVVQNDGQGNFSAKPLFSIGNGGGKPIAIVAGDFNGDGYLDMAVAKNKEDDVSLLLNNPAAPGTFTIVHLPLPTGAGAFDIIAAQLNDDNLDGKIDDHDKLDLAVANFGKDSVTVFLNDGLGGFLLGDTIDLNGTPTSGIFQPCALAAGDLNGDGKPELAVANFNSNDISLILNDGAGVFTPYETRQRAGYNPMSINAADMDGDGKLELVVTNKYRTSALDPSFRGFSVLHNYGDPSEGEFLFSGLDTYPAGVFPDGIAFASLVLYLNDDNKPEVVTANGCSSGHGNVSVSTNSTVPGAFIFSIKGYEQHTDKDFGLKVQVGAPSFTKIDDPGTVSADAGMQAIPMKNIVHGAGTEVSITATSSNPDLIPNPIASPETVSLPQDTSTLSYTPNSLESGTAVITVTATNGGKDGILATTYDNVSFFQKFTVRVDPINHSPKLDDIPDPPRIDQNAVEQQIILTGINAGDGDAGQPLTVTAASSNPALISTPTVIYTSPNTEAILRYKPNPGQSGQAVITVTVTDDSLDPDLPNKSTTKTFTVNVYYNPTAKNDTFSGVPANGQNVVLDVLANDLCDPHGDLYISSLANLNGNGKTIGGGTVSISGDHARLQYTPAAGFVGTDTFAYWVTKTSNGETASKAVVTLTVGSSGSRIWDGGGADNLWTTAANWVGDVAPFAGESLIFPADAARTASVNDFPAGTVFGSIDVLGNNYHFQSGVIRSGTIAVRGTNSLTATSIVCDTLIIGGTSSATPASANVVFPPAAEAARFVPDAISMVPVTVDAERESHAMDGSSFDAPSTLPNAGNAMVVVAFSEVITLSLNAAISRADDFAQSALKAYAAAIADVPVERQIAATFAPQTAPTASMVRLSMPMPSSDAFLPAEFDRESPRMIPSLFPAKNWSEENGFDDLAESLALSKKRTTAGAAGNRISHEFALQSLLGELEDRIERERNGEESAAKRSDREGRFIGELLDLSAVTQDSNL